MHDSTAQATRLSAWMIAVCAAVALFCLLFPIYVIRPFRAQGLAELDAALLVMRMRPWITAACAAISGALVVRHWRANLTRTARIGMAATAGIAGLAAILSHINIYERMFHRVDAPSFESTTDSRLHADEHVLAIRAGAEARAYPVRALAYHHIVNDELGSVPVVATY